MRILLLGSGGREHAIAWKLAQSKKLNKLFIAPGNPGTKECGENVSLDIMNFPQIAKFALDNSVEYIVVGPEAPLVAGIYDYFQENPELNSIKLIAPSQEGAALEGSKDFAKDFMQRYNIPTAGYYTVEKGSLEDGYAYIDSLKAPYVLKADGLAGGKGVMILNDSVAAKSMLKEMLNGKFGTAGSKVVIEEYLDGIEVSVFFLTDGKSYKILPEAKDYKRIGDNDEGLNTGGMGAVSPVCFADAEFIEKIRKRIIEPTIQGLQKEGIEYKGFVFLGIMNCNGDPMVIEYNVRMGDPETEVVMPRLNADLADLLEGVAMGDLDKRECLIYPETVLTVVAASGGYPESYEIGFPIQGLDFNSGNDTLVFHAGTKEENNRIVTNSGRVLTVTALGSSIVDAQLKAYSRLDKISYKGRYFRKDIGNDLNDLNGK